MQRNWIGKSTGAEIKFKISGTGEFLKYYYQPILLWGNFYCCLNKSQNSQKGIGSRPIEN